MLTDFTHPTPLFFRMFSECLRKTASSSPPTSTGSSEWRDCETRDCGPHHRTQTCPSSLLDDHPPLPLPLSRPAALSSWLSRRGGSSTPAPTPPVSTARAMARQSAREYRMTRMEGEEQAAAAQVVVVRLSLHSTKRQQLQAAGWEWRMSASPSAPARLNSTQQTTAAAASPSFVSQYSE